MGGNASENGVWRLGMTAGMARPGAAGNVYHVWDRRHVCEALSVSESKRRAGLRDTDYAMR